MREIKKRAVIKLAKAVAAVQANSSCVFWAYQPQVPPQLKKLKKF